MDLLNEVKRAQRGDKGAFVGLIHYYEKDMYRFSKSMLKNEEDCCDAVQETLLKAYRAITYLNEPKYFKTWLFKILINNCYQIYREKNKVATTFQLDDVPIDCDLYGGLELRQVIESLEDNLKKLVIMHYLEDMPVKEISEILNIPSGTVKSRLSRARARLSQILDDEGGEMCYE